MIHNYDKDLTLAVAGSGEFHAANVADNIYDFILGSKAERHCTLVLPLFSKMTANMKQFIEWTIDNEFDDYIFVQSEGAPMTQKISGLSKNPDVKVNFLRVETDRDVLKMMMQVLQLAKDAEEDLAFAMMYDPQSTYVKGKNPPSDFEILGEMKFIDWLPTYNICEGMQDSFEGYESAEEKESREKAEAEYAEKMALESPQTPRKRVARKTAAKKTTAPKTEPQSATPGLDKLIADAVEKDKAQPKTELSAKVHIGDKAWIDPDDPSVAADVLANLPVTSSPQDRQKVLLKQLTQNIADITTAFNATLATISEMVDELA